MAHAHFAAIPALHFIAEKRSKKGGARETRNLSTFLAYTKLDMDASGCFAL